MKIFRSRKRFLLPLLLTILLAVVSYGTWKSPERSLARFVNGFVFPFGVKIKKLYPYPNSIKIVAPSVRTKDFNIRADTLEIEFSLTNFIASKFNPYQFVQAINLVSPKATFYLPDTSSNDSIAIEIPEIPDKIFQQIRFYFHIDSLNVKDASITLRRNKDNLKFKVISNFSGKITKTTDSKQISVNFEGDYGEVEKTKLKLKGEIYPKIKTFFLLTEVDEIYLEDFQKFIPTDAISLGGKISLKATANKVASTTKPSVSAKVDFLGVNLKIVDAMEITGLIGQARVKNLNVEEVNLAGKFEGADFQVSGNLGEVTSPTLSATGQVNNIDLKFVENFISEEEIRKYLPKGKIANLIFVANGDIINPDVNFTFVAKEIDVLPFLKIKNVHTQGNYFDLEVDVENFSAEVLKKTFQSKGNLKLTDFENFYDLTYQVKGDLLADLNLGVVDSLLGKIETNLRGKAAGIVEVPSIRGVANLDFLAKGLSLQGNYFFGKDSSKIFLLDSLRESKIILSVENPIDSLTYELQTEKFSAVLAKIFPDLQNEFESFEIEFSSSGTLQQGKLVTVVREKRRRKLDFFEIKSDYKIVGDTTELIGEIIYHPTNDVRLNGDFEVQIDSEKLTVKRFNFANYLMVKGTYFFDKKEDLDFDLEVTKINFEDIFTILQTRNSLGFQGGQITGRTKIRGNSTKPLINSSLEFIEVKAGNLEGLSGQLLFDYDGVYPKTQLFVNEKTTELVNLTSVLSDKVLKSVFAQEQISLKSIFQFAGIDSTEIAKNIFGKIRYSGESQIDEDLNTFYKFNIANGDSFGVNFGFPQDLPISFNLNAKDKVNDFKTLKEQSFEIESFDVVIGNDFVFSAQGKIPYSNTGDNIDLEIKVTGDFTSILPKVSDLFIAKKSSNLQTRTSKDTLILKFEGNLDDIELAKAHLKIENRTLRFTELFKRKDFEITNIDLNFEAQNGNFLRLYAEAKFRGRKILIRNFENPYIASENKYLFDESPIFFEDFGGLNLGLISVEIPNGLKDVNLTGFMNESELIKAEILKPSRESDFLRNAVGDPIFKDLALEKLKKSGVSEEYVEQMNSIFISGYEDTYKLSGRATAYDGEFTLDFLIEEASSDTTFSTKLVDGIEWNLDLLIGDNTWLYQRPQFKGNKFRLDEELSHYELDMRLDENPKGIKIRGSFDDFTFGIDGDISSTLGTIEVWNKDFRIEEFKIIFDRYNEFPIFEGIATRVEQVGQVNYEIYVVPVRVDTLHGVIYELTDNVRLDPEKIRFKIFSNNPDWANLYDILAFWGILGTTKSNDPLAAENEEEQFSVGQTGKNFIIGAGANYIDNFLHRYLKYSERRLTRWLPIDYIKIRPSFIQNLAERLIYTAETTGTEAARDQSANFDIFSGSSFVNSSLSIGKKIPISPEKGVMVNYTGKLVNGLIDQEENKFGVGIKHNASLEYRFTTRFSVRYEYSYDFEFATNRNDQRILFRHTIKIK
ncbi:MAG: hypothetical protein DWQ06_06895 [Calditrichaeota bacterium]|nr:MAG: hypothetical protein DWQ06_06895 [Calditrichota bacterium]